MVANREMVSSQGIRIVHSWRESWQAKGFYLAPNLLNRKDLPPLARLLAHAIYGRAMGSMDHVQVSVEGLAREVGICRQTAHRYLNILEMEGLIARERRGKMQVSVIWLSLKRAGQKMCETIPAVLYKVGAHFARWPEKRRVSWWVDRYRKWKEARKPLEMMP